MCSQCVVYQRVTSFNKITISRISYLHSTDKQIEKIVLAIRNLFLRFVMELRAFFDNSLSPMQYRAINLNELQI